MLTSPWLLPVIERPFGPRVIAFPYAGGSSAMFRAWAPDWLPGVSLYAVEPPGRGRRLGEPPAVTIGEMVEAVMHAIAGDLARPFVLYGHSLGGLVAFEVAQACHRQFGREPEALIVSASRPPHVALDSAPETLTDEEVVERLESLGATPPEILGHAQLMALLMPALKADFTIARRHVSRAPVPLKCAIDVFAGRADTACTPEKLMAWKDLTTGPFRHSVMEGGHFFIQERPETFLTALRGRLTERLSALAMEAPQP